MYNRVIATNADLVECDVYRVNNETGIETYRVCSGVMGQDYTLEDHMKYGYTEMWNLPTAIVKPEQSIHYFLPWRIESKMCMLHFTIIESFGRIL